MKHTPPRESAAQEPRQRWQDPREDLQGTELMNGYEAGFKRRDMSTARFCPADQIHNPENWPGVISSRSGSNFWWRDGEQYDPETAEMTALELAAQRFEFDDEKDERQQMEATDL